MGDWVTLSRAQDGRTIYVNLDAIRSIVAHDQGTTVLAAAAGEATIAVKERPSEIMEKPKARGMPRIS